MVGLLGRRQENVQNTIYANYCPLALQDDPMDMNREITMGSTLADLLICSTFAGLERDSAFSRFESLSNCLPICFFVGPGLLQNRQKADAHQLKCISEQNRSQMTSTEVSFRRKPVQYLKQCVQSMCDAKLFCSLFIKFLVLVMKLAELQRCTIIYSIIAEMHAI